MALSSWLNVLNGESEDNSFASHFVVSILPQWEQRQPEAAALLADFEKAMSPRNLFEMPPLCNCSTSTSAWLAEVTHLAWQKRHDVTAKLDQCRECLQQIDGVYWIIRAKSQGLSVDIADWFPLEGDFECLCNHCRHLAEAISRLPWSVIL